MAKALAEFGSVDILVNNAGIQFVAPIDEFPVAKWNAILALNLTASFHTIRLALPAMKAKKWGRILNIASAHALVASPFKSAYVAAKHGIAGLTKTVALEVATQGITMNAICPGYVWTPLVEKQIPDTAKARGLTEAQVISDVLLHAQPTKQFVQVVRSGGARDVSRERCGRIDHRRSHSHRRRLDCAVSHAATPATADKETRMATTRKRRNSAGNGDARIGRNPAFPGQVVLVLQGGGALGAYQVGVYEALHEGRHRARLGDRHVDRRNQRRA